jgi:lysophospholipase L1-like esterase
LSGEIKLLISSHAHRFLDALNISSPQSTEHIVFFGDSTSATGRDYTNPDSLGNGYVNLLAARFRALRPGRVRVTNRGSAGNRVFDLEERFQHDVLDLSPTLVSILIGINDTWRRYDSDTISDLDEFQACYARILDRLNAAGIRAVLLEPFLLPVPEDRKAWREDLDPRIGRIRELALERGLPYLPLDGIFAAAATATGAAYWLPDGVHPSLGGHGLIAEHWYALYDSVLSGGN